MNSGKTARATKFALGSMLLAASVVGGYVFGFDIAAGTSSLSTQARQPVATSRPLVEITEARPRQFFDRVNAVATTRARQSIDVYASTAGRVIWVGIEPGAAVKTGDVLLKLDDDSQDAAVHQAEASVAETQAQSERTDQLFKNKAIPASEREAANAAWLRAKADLELAQSNHRQRSVLAAFDGLVGLTNLRIGSRVETSTLVTTLDDLTAVEVSFSVPERYFPRVKLGQPVELRTEAYPDRVFNATIAAVDTRIDPVSRVISLRATVPNDDRALVGGMLINASLQIGSRDAVAVPAYSIISENDRSHVFLLKGDKATKTDIRLGATDDDMVEVVAGLAPSDKVITSGLHLVTDGTDVEIKEPRTAGLSE